MDEEAIKNADPETREQLRIIAIETSLEEVQKQFFERLATLENRVKVLEEARLRQIELNKTFQVAGKNPVLTISDTVKTKKWWW